MNLIKIGEDIEINTGIEFTKSNTKIELTPKAKERIVKCRRTLNKINQKEEPVYGVSTGFGHLQNTWISRDKQKQLQTNLIRSHAIGVEPKVPKEITRTAMILLVNSLSKGNSGIKLSTVELLVKMINNDIIPISYTIGSLGASGDLAPLAHVALSLIGEGEVNYENKVYDTMDIFNKFDINPISLDAKEGLALINGTHFVTAYSLHILAKCRKVLAHSFIASGLSIEAIRATDVPFDSRISSLRRQPGHAKISKIIREILKDSKIIESHQDPSVDHKTQDAYALRCIPQVMGAVWDSIAYLERTAEYEINAVTDNPLIFPEEEEILSGGNFHAEPLGIPLEAVSVGLVEAANITEARISRLVSPYTKELPAFLANKPGLESGYMLAHYTVAALLNKLRSLAHPSVTDNIPVSGNQEDHVSMAMNAATKTWEIVNIVEKIVAFEILMGYRGLKMVEHPKSSLILEKVISIISENISFKSEDHVIREELIEMLDLIDKEDMLDIVDEIIPKRFDN